jgi:hypothetical protein
MLDQSKPSNAAAQAKLDVAPTEYRLRLRRAGFDPLPVSGKQVFLEGWSTKTNTSENDIRLWGKLWPDWTNTGVLTRLAPAIDLDITDPEAAEAVEELARERFEERGHILVRIGKAPKRAILLRTPEPFKKLSAGLIAPNGDTTQKIEILGNGQQLVVAGIHPETGLPYNWHGGEPGKIKLDELPDISADEARAFLDEAVELLVRDFGYRRDGKPAAGNGHATPANGTTDAPGERADWNQLVANIHAGTTLHDSTRDLAAGLIAKGLDAGGTITVLRSLMHASSAERDARWRERLDDIPNLVNGAAGKFAKPAPEPITPFETFDAGNWEGVGIAPRRWTILNRIPAGEPGIISGDGGTGKTLLMLQACVAIASELPDWMNGVVDTHGPVIVFSAEEKLGEMHRRVGRILAYLGLSFRDLAGRLHFVCDPDDVTLATVDRDGLVAPSRSLLRLEKSVQQIRPAFVLIENAAEVYPANEIVRSPVARFVRKCLGGLAGPNDAAVGLIQHPSVSGLKDGTGRSGSTGWSNAGRWRMNFTYADADGDDDGVSPTGIRKLEIIKSNYGPAGEIVRVCWHQEHGVFVPVGTGSAVERAATEAPVDDAFLRCLDAVTAREEAVGTNSKGNWAPRVFAGCPKPMAISSGRC